jgi:hypothetical protein
MNLRKAKFLLASIAAFAVIAYVALPLTSIFWPSLAVTFFAIVLVAASLLVGHLVVHRLELW